MWRFVVIGQTALASSDFSLADLPSTSGRLDVLLRAVRAAFLVSHELRRDVMVYLVLRGGARAPRVLRIDGRSVKFLRPDERSLAVLVQKTLAVTSTGFQEVRPGLALCDGDVPQVLDDIGPAPRYLLDERGEDVRAQALPKDDAVFFVGDHLGFDADTLARLQDCTRISVGPVSLHSDDVVTLLLNELDRRAVP